MRVILTFALLAVINLGCAASAKHIAPPVQQQGEQVQVQDCKPGPVINGKLIFNCTKVKH